MQVIAKLTKKRKCEVDTARMIRNVRDQVDSEIRGAKCLRSEILVCFLHQTEN